MYWAVRRCRACAKNFEPNPMWVSAQSFLFSRVPIYIACNDSDVRCWLFLCEPHPWVSHKKGQYGNIGDKIAFGLWYYFFEVLERCGVK